MEKQYWVIEREKDQKVVFRSIIPVGQITDAQLENLIIALNVKHKLTDDEAIPCFFRRNVTNYSNFLNVKRDSRGRRTVVYCENTLDITASLYNESEVSALREN